MRDITMLGSCKIVPNLSIASMKTARSNEIKTSICAKIIYIILEQIKEKDIINITFMDII